MLAACAALPATPRAVPVMSFDEVAPGMRGTGRTVFRGTEVESFAIEGLERPLALDPRRLRGRIVRIEPRGSVREPWRSAQEARHDASGETRGAACGSARASPPGSTGWKRRMTERAWPRCGKRRSAPWPRRGPAWSW
jgi:hypothetical protein